MDGGAGKLGVKLLQQRGQPGGSDAGQSADAQRAALLGGGCHPKFVLLGLDLLHDAQQFRSRWGKGDPLPFPAEKLYPQFLFQIGGEVAQTGLGIAQALSGPGEAAQLGDAEDGFILSDGRHLLP